MEQLLFPHLALTSYVLPFAVQHDPVSVQLQLCCTVSLGFSLCEPGTIVPAVTAWQAAGKALPQGCTVDLGLPKKGAEWLLAGNAIAADPLQEMAVHVQVGEIQRTFLVFGDRMDDGAGNVSPAPFTSMPLDWAHTFGGSGCAANPAGRGASEEHGGRLLPNVCAWTGRGVDLTSPACPLPVDMLTRPLPAGTFDAAWLATLWPAPPLDFDWSWYNLAQPEQRTEKTFTGLEGIRIHGMHASGTLISSLPGQRLRVFADYCQTPSSAYAGWYEMQPFADTVWLFPNEGLGLQLWHVLCPCADERASTIRQLAACLEDARGAAHGLEELLQQRLSLLTAAPAAPAAEMPEAEQPPAAAAPVPPDLPETPETPDLPAAPGTAVPAGLTTAEEPGPENMERQLSQAVKQARAELPDLLASLNPMLEQQGLQPVQLSEVESQLARQEQSILAAMAAQKARSAPESEEDLARSLLHKAGITQEDWHKLDMALELSPPDPKTFASDAAFDAALESYGDRFAELTKAPDKVRASLLKELRRAARLQKEASRTPPAPETLAEIAPELATTLHRAGLGASEDAIISSFTKLDSLSEQGFAGDAALLSLIQDISLAMGLDPQQGTQQIQSLLAGARRVIYADTDLQKDLKLLLQQHNVATKDQNRLLALLTRTGTDSGKGENSDLQDCARTCGLVSPELLADLKSLDPLPATPPDLSPQTDQAAAEDHADTAPDAEKSAAQATQDAADTMPEEDAAPEDTAPPLPADFSGQKLDGMSFAGLDLTNALFEKASLRNCDFTGCMLAEARFAGADLTGAIFAEACLHSADLTGCILSQADLRKARAADATFDDCQMDGVLIAGLAGEEASFRKVAADRLNFAGCRLAKARFEGASLLSASFSQACLQETSFHECRLSGADFQEADMHSVRITYCSLDGACLAGTNAADSNWLACQGKNLDVREAVLTRATFENCRLVSSSFAAISARECRFLSCELSGSDFRCADLFSGALRGCQLASCDLSSASLFAADLLYIRLDQSTLFTDTNLERTILARRLS